jgi:hypothetical protein
MAVIGNTPTQQAFTPAIDYFSGTGSATAFTLSRPVASVAQVQVVIDNVAQNPSSAYTVSSNTITFTSAPLSGTNNIYVYYTSPITQVIAPGQGTVVSSSFGTITDFTTTGNTTLGDATTDTLTIGVTGIVKDATGKVGIGTASPNDVLEVAGNDAYIRVNRTGNEPGILLTYSNSATNRGNIAVTSGGAMYFTSGGNTERMRIDSSGNVLVGITSNPSGLFKIVAAGTDNNNLIGSYNTASGNAGIRIQANQAGLYLQGSGTVDPLYITNSSSTGYIVFRPSSDTERMRIDSSGNLLVGNSSVGGTGWSMYPTGYAITNGSTSTFTHISFQTSSAQKGYIQTVGSTTNYNGSSDYRLKENVIPLPNALQTIAQLKPVKFNWKEDNSVGYSFIAHELQEVVPQAVGGTKDEVDENGKPVYQGVDPSKLVCFLTAAIQELKAINDTQAETINALTARIEALENR